MFDKYHFNLSTQSGKFDIQIDGEAQYGYFEHETLGDECGGGLWFKDNILYDADGTFEVPKDVVKGIRALGFFVPRVFEPDSIKVITHPCDVPGFEIFEYEDKEWSTQFFWIDDCGSGSPVGFDSIEAATAGAGVEAAKRSPFPRRGILM